MKNKKIEWLTFLGTLGLIIPIFERNPNTFVLLGLGVVFLAIAYKLIRN
ncbi:MAG: hypothetical protein QG639_279 [Patescibacteria group bacterium]|nr:hypothetical protein [Patescibacteria group bacterium]